MATEHPPFSAVRFCAISDTHTKHRQVRIPPCDVLLLGGDMTYQGEMSVIADIARWTDEVIPRETTCVMISGNHDFCFEDPETKAQALQFLSEWTYLEDSGTTVHGVNIWGSPWTPRFHDWAWNLDRGRPLRNVWAKVPENTDLLLVHGPPHGVVDRTSDGRHPGCEELLARVKTLPGLQVVVCGHIHEARGEGVIGTTRVLNVSTLDLYYRTVRPPVTFEVTPSSQHTTSL